MRDGAVVRRASRALAAVLELPALLHRDVRVLERALVTLAGVGEAVQRGAGRGPEGTTPAQPLRSPQRLGPHDRATRIQG